jgi:hypothetical protein
MMFHPVHVTLTTIDQAPGSDTLRVTFRMYYDDFKRDYRMFDDEIQEIPDEKSIPFTSINEYFNNRVKIYINNRLLKGRLMDVEIPDNYEIILSLLYLSDREPEKFRIRNKILTRIYSDQKNMIFISINKYDEGITLTARSRKESIKLK